MTTAMILESGKMPQTKKEVWKDLFRFPGYEVSDRGRVRSYHKHTNRSGRVNIPHLLGQGTDRDGYKVVELHVNGKALHRLVHRLVLEAFVGLCPKGMMTRHLDGIRSHNTVSNLLWGTHEENTEDMVRHGNGHVPHPGVLGRQHPLAVSLTKRDVGRIVYLGRSRLLTRRKIAKKFGVSKSVIDAILNGSHWLVRGASI